jgi:hypothetical protein
MYKSSIDILTLELKPNSITNDGLTSVSPSIAKPPVGGSFVCNPFKLVWYNSKWSEKKTAINNAKYWEWEINNNNFKCP